MDSDTVWTRIDAARAELADLFDTLTPQQWETPSLCAGWTVRDIVAPDRVVLVGQAFTGCPAVLEDVTGAMAQAAVLGEVPVSFTRFGAGIQAVAACTIALGAVYDDPLGLVASAR